MKRLIICCDGTWQTLSSPCPTNVVKMAQAIKPVASDGTAQVVYYDQGIGTGETLDKLTGGAFGWGIDENIQDAYRFICFNYSPGDQIYLFGYSRGAYTVRSLAGLINCSGLVSRTDIRDTAEAYNIYREQDDHQRKTKSQAFRDAHLGQVKITVLGCWDTVGALGIPDQLPFLSIDELINKKYKFHDTILSASIQHAFHAVAIDEPRKVFDVTPMQKNPTFKEQVLRQVWFPGEHTSIGGGIFEHRGLSDTTLKWMMDQITQRRLGLEFNLSAIKGGITMNHKTPFDTDTIIGRLTGEHKRKVVASVVDPATGKTIQKPIDLEDLHESVRLRWRDLGKDYRPSNLLPYNALLEEREAIAYPE